MIVFLVAAALPVGPAWGAGASALYTRVLHAYQATGRVPPCQFTSPQLASALDQVDTYGQQYYADFIGAITSALDARASGACSGKGQGGLTTSGRPTGSSGQSRGAPVLPLSVTAPTRSGLPLPMVLLLGPGALLLALALLARWGWQRGSQPRWTAILRHGATEARYRTEGMWLALRDRLGR